MGRNGEGWGEMGRDGETSGDAHLLLLGLLLRRGGSLLLLLESPPLALRMPARVRLHVRRRRAPRVLLRAQPPLRILHLHMHARLQVVREEVL